MTGSGRRSVSAFERRSRLKLRDKTDLGWKSSLGSTRPPFSRPVVSGKSAPSAFDFRLGPIVLKVPHDFGKGTRACLFRDVLRCHRARRRRGAGSRGLPWLRCPANNVQSRMVCRPRQRQDGVGGRSRHAGGPMEFASGSLLSVKRVQISATHDRALCARCDHWIILAGARRRPDPAGRRDPADEWELWRYRDWLAVRRREQLAGLRDNRRRAGPSSGVDPALYHVLFGVCGFRPQGSISWRWSNPVGQH